jgi:NAD-dependent SIR2 family protein deacetylase
MLKDCKHCGIEFNTDTARKRQVGGRVNECPDCVEEMGTETAVPYAGVMAGDGKQGGTVKDI